MKQETIEQIDQNNPVTRGSTALAYKKETKQENFEESAVGLKNNLLENLIELNKRAIFENWKMEDVGEEFFKIFVYSDKPISSECEHKNKTQHFSDVFGHYTSCTTCGRDF